MPQQPLSSAFRLPAQMRTPVLHFFRPLVDELFDLLGHPFVVPGAAGGSRFTFELRGASLHVNETGARLRRGVAVEAFLPRLGRQGYRVGRNAADEVFEDLAYASGARSGSDYQFS